VLLRDREQRHRLLHQARVLAETGRYRGWRDVESALLCAGRKEAPRALSPFLTRFMLSARCARAIRRMKADE
jgi:hypothetical protein